MPAFPNFLVQQEDFVAYHDLDDYVLDFTLDRVNYWTCFDKLAELLWLKFSLKYCCIGTEDCNDFANLITLVPCMVINFARALNFTISADEHSSSDHTIESDDCYDSFNRYGPQAS